MILTKVQILEKVKLLPCACGKQLTGTKHKILGDLDIDGPSSEYHVKCDMQCLKCLRTVIFTGVYPCQKTNE